MLPLLQSALEGARLSGPTPYSILLIGSVSPIAVAVVGYMNHRKGTRRDSARRTEFAEIKETMAANHLETTSELQELRAYVIGPDGKNGIRGDVRALKEEVKGLVDRERDRLEQKALHNYDRRS